MSAAKTLARPVGGRVQSEDVTSGMPSGRAGQLSFEDEIALRAEGEQSWDEWVRSLPLSPS